METNKIVLKDENKRLVKVIKQELETQLEELKDKQRVLEMQISALERELENE